MWDTYLQPTSVAETLGLLQRYGGQARIVAGGTDVLVELSRGAAELRSSRASRARGGRPSATLIDVTRLPDLKYVRDDGRCLRLGALATHNDVLASPSCVRHALPLAQACREHYSRRTSIVLWVICEIAIAACDLAEVLGSAVALKLLFGLPLLAGVLITALDVLIVLALQGRGFRLIEAFVVTLILTIGACFAYEIFFARPLWLEAARGFLPTAEILRNREMLYIAIGILGATVMPHNLYLHSSIVQTRAFGFGAGEKKEALRFAVLDSTLALGFALFINAAILVLGAAAFHTRGLVEVAEIADAYKLLSPVPGVSFASTLFACALLASGQNSTLTGTLAGQIVMEGFLEIRLKPWLRRLITRAIAIVPAALVIGFAGEGKVTSLLILSQVILSFQLPFAVIPLIQFTSDRKLMGKYVNPRWLKILAWTAAVTIAGLNALLLFQIFRKT